MNLETELAIVGAGPAGVSAALMADSLGLAFVLLERSEPGFSVRSIPDIRNTVGFTRGADLADALASHTREFRGSSDLRWG